MGEFDTESEIDCVDTGTDRICADPPQDIPVEDTIVHPGYNPLDPNQPHDIALIILERNVTYTGTQLLFKLSKYIF